MSPNSVDVLSGADTPIAATGRRGKAARPRWLRVLSFMAFSFASALLPAACAQADRAEEDADPEDDGEAVAALDGCWDPVFGAESCFQGDWWVEFSTEDETTAAMEVEVSGTPTSRVVPLSGRVPLWSGYVKFTGGPGSPIPAGTLIRLRATRSAAAGGHEARSAWFAYRQTTPAVDCGDCVPSCPPGACGSDGCGGTCACSAGDVCMADQTCCHPSSAPCGPDGCGGSHGACPCEPSCAGKLCGDDGCGGSCGTCAAGTICAGGACVAGCEAPWNPVWQPTANNGSWWTELRVAGGGSLARSVTFQVVGGEATPLSGGYGMWTGGLGGVPPGTLVVLRATDATGATAQTAPFRYLVDTVPVTDPCEGTPSTSPGCAPLTRGMVSFTMDDSHPSQSTLASPALVAHGFRATIYHIAESLEIYGLLPHAQALAAAGHEIGSHSRTHPYLTSLSPQALDDEMRLSKQYLLSNVGSPVESFASPMGAYNEAALTALRPYFTSHRTVNPGLNYMGSDVYELRADGVYNNDTVSQVCAQLAETAALRGWRILVFHDFTTAATTDMQLAYPIARFEGVLQCAASTPGLDVVTVREGAAAIACASP
jgi:peptidoglycan/xylan/chitin deacetylase (PgdA/CDA1 family)